MIGDLVLNGGIIRHTVEVPQMAFKALSVGGKLGALLVALPNVGLIVLAIFMSLPVILAAELFIAAIRGAAVWSLMALHMLPAGRSVSICGG